MNNIANTNTTGAPQMPFQVFKLVSETEQVQPQENSSTSKPDTKEEPKVEVIQQNESLPAFSNTIANADYFEDKHSEYSIIIANNQMLISGTTFRTNIVNSNNVTYPTDPNPYCQIPYLPTSQREHHSHRNTAKKSDELICTGKIEVIRKLAEFDEKGHRTDYAVIRITGANLTTTEVNVPKEYVTNHKFIQEIFEKNEGIVHAPGKLSFLCQYLANQYQNAKWETINKGFSIQQDRIHHSEEAEIYKNACEIPDCRTRFGLCDNIIKLPVASLLTVATYSEIWFLMTQIGHKAKPIVVLNCDNIDTAKSVLGKAFPNAPQIALGKQMEVRLAEIQSKLAFIIADSGNSYFADKLVEIMDKSGSDGAAEINCLPMVVTTSKNLFKCSSDRLINMKLDDSINEHSERVVFWLMKRLISESGGITLKEMSAKYKEYSSLLDNDPSLNDVSAPFFAALLTIFDTFISSWELEAGNHQRLIEAMTNYLIDTNEGCSDSIIERLKAAIMANNGIPVFDRVRCTSITPNGIILVDSEKISLDNISFAKFSELCGFEKPRNFAEALKTEGLLLTDGKLQKKVSLPMAEKNENMYCLAVGKLFEFGEQIPETDEFAFGAPEVQLRLGITTANKPLYFTFSRTDGSQNANVYISGSSGKGKSTLLRQWARESARNGLETVIIDTDGQFSRTMTGDEVVVYSIGDEYSISSSASGGTLIAAANACVNLSTKQRNELKEYSVSIGKCQSIKELFGHFDQMMYGNTLTTLADVNSAMQSSGIPDGKELSWNDICHRDLISVLDLSSLDVTDIKPILDLILEELFAHKKSKQDKGVVTCTLILDEVQNFNLDGLSPLAHQILRQGRKFGISTVMATQYLSSDDAKNIGKLLKQCESFCSFKPANALDTMKIMSLEKNEAAEYCLNNLETGQVIVSGAFSTDRCSIRYPVKVFVENDK